MHQCPTQLSTLSSRIKAADILEIQFLPAHVRTSCRKWRLATLPSLTHCRNPYHKRRGLMDIGAEKTEEFRQELQDTVFHGDIINSDAVEGLQDIMEASRKRAASNVSQISSTRQPSPTKKT